MAVLVVITPKNEKELVILRASLNIIQPISKMNLNGPIAFKMYEADVKTLITSQVVEYTSFFNRD